MHVTLENMSVNYGADRVVNELSLQIGDGELLALLGPSGCGKTTTLLAVGGFEPPSGGKIYFGDREVTDEPPRKRNIGICFQSYALYPTKSVRENIGFPLRVRGEPADAIQVQVMEAAKMLELDTLLDRMPSALSGGQQQRVALARALVKRPDLLLLDEPLSNLDARLRVTTRAQIKAIQRKLGIPTILVTHDQLEAMSIADRIAIMRDGQIEQIGSPQDCYHRPRSLFVASFIGAHPINILQTTSEGSDRILLDADSDIGFSGLGLNLNSPLPTKITAAIRPEYVEIGDKGDLPAEVTLVEPLGKEHLVSCATPAGPIRALVDEIGAPQTGDQVSVFFPRQSLLLFDAETGIACERVKANTE